MSSMTSPRGPLPPRVYWVRRTAVVLALLLAVFAVAQVIRLIGGGGGGAQATTVSDKSDRSTSPTPVQVTTSAPSTGASQAPSPSPALTKKQKKQQQQAAAQAAASPTPTSTPEGPCLTDEVTVAPTLTQVTGGSEAPLALRVTTTGSNACSWKVSPDDLVVKITSGKDRVWSSQDCPAAIPTGEVVVRPANEPATELAVGWSGRRSEEGCPNGTSWAKPGFYHVTAASLGGQPTDVQFEVTAPPQATVTKTAKPKQGKNKQQAAATPTG